MFERDGTTARPPPRLGDERGGGGGRRDLPSMRWVVRELLPRARGARRSHDRPNPWPREEAGEAYGYGALDVSWTRPDRLVPFPCRDRLLSRPSSARGAEEGQGGQALPQRVRTLLGLWDDVHGGASPELVRIKIPAAQVSLVDSGTRRGGPERETLPPHVEAALRGHSTTPLASGTSSSFEDDDGDSKDRVKRARHTY